MDEDVKVVPVEESPKKNKYLIYVGMATILLFSILYIVLKDGNNQTHTEEISKTILLSEIATHNSKDDCWTTINGEVFDVTKFIPQHKGKEKILNACGVDATDFFTGKSPLGRVHSQVAVNLLSTMKIGTLQK